MKATKLTLITFFALTIVSILIGTAGGAILLDRVRESYRALEIQTNQRQGDRVAMLFEFLQSEGMSEEEILGLFQKTIASTSGTPERFICVLSNKGDVLCHPNDAALGNNAEGISMRATKTGEALTYASWIKSNYGEAYVLSPQGDPVDLVHRVPIQDFPWQVLVHTKLDVIEEQAAQIQRVIIMWLVPMLGAFVLIGTFVARSIGRRYEAAIEEANRDLEERVGARTAELRHTVDELQHARDAVQLNEKMALLGQLVAGIAHEINNPLNAISIHAQSLEEYLENEEDREAVRTINQSAQRCGHLVTNLLAFARNSPPHRAHHSINEVINTALAFCAADLRQLKITLRKELSPANPEIEVDKIQIEQVILNLVTNAAQALADQDGERIITIETAEENGTVSITCDDNGPGLPEDIQGSIFEPFHTTKEEGEGTGLGLSLCRRFIEHHGGTICYDRSPLGGARFRFTLPKAGTNGASSVVIENEEVEQC